MRKFWQLLIQYWWIVAIVSTVISVVIALLIGATQSVWFDESYSVILARSPWRDLFSLTAVDAHPPLYYVLLKIWSMIGGLDALWLRILSAIFSGGTVFLMLFLVRRIFSRRVAIISAPILTLAPFMLRYGFEIRMYSLASLIAVASTLMLVKIVEKKSSSKLWILYGILVTLGMLTLNYMVFVFVAQLVWLILHYYKNRKKTDKIWQQNWFKALALSVILYLPWAPFAIDQFHNSVSSGVATALGVSEVMNILSFGLVYTPYFWLDKFASAAVIIATILIIYLTIKTWRDNKKYRPILQLLLLIFLSPFAMMMLFSLISSDGFFMERYMAHFVWAGYLLIGIVAAMNLLNAKALKQKIIATVAYLFIIAVLISGVINLANFGNYNFQRMQENAMQEIVEKIGGCDPDQIIIVDDTYKYMEILYYLPDCDSLYFYSPWDIEYRGGFAPVSSDPQRIIDQRFDTPRMIVIRIKNRVNFEAPSDFKLQSVIEKYDVINIEFYEKR